MVYLSQVNMNKVMLTNYTMWKHLHIGHDWCFMAHQQNLDKYNWNASTLLYLIEYVLYQSVIVCAWLNTLKHIISLEIKLVASGINLCVVHLCICIIFYYVA